MKKLVLLILASLSFSTFAGSDSGVITELFVDDIGSVAIKLDNGFPNAIAANECPTNNGWAGVSATAAPALKSALLAAKASRSPVIVTTTGCTSGGGWIKVNGIYVNE